MSMPSLSPGGMTTRAGPATRRPRRCRCYPGRPGAPAEPGSPLRARLRAQVELERVLVLAIAWSADAGPWEREDERAARAARWRARDHRRAPQGSRGGVQPLVRAGPLLRRLHDRRLEHQWRPVRGHQGPEGPALPGRLAG